MATEAQEFAALRRLQPAEAVAYLQRRGQLALTYAWQDLWQDEHAYHFTVSRLAQVDLLEALRDKITASVDGDLSRRDFVRDAKEVLARAGWWGENTVEDPVTKREVTTTFDPSRLQLIYETNTRMAYAAGQWERFQTTKRSHPYLRYITLGDERVRESHREWADVTLPVDDAFWRTHLPPNGWRCRCRVVAVNQREYERGKTPRGGSMRKSAPPTPSREWIDQRTGEIRMVPKGIDPGFDYNVGIAGARAAELQAQVAGKLAKLPPGLAAAARRAGLGGEGTTS